MIISIGFLILVSLSNEKWTDSNCRLTQEDALYFVTIDQEKVELPTAAAHPELRACRLSEDKQFLIVEVLQGLQGTQSLRASVDLIVYKKQDGKWLENKLVSVGRVEKTKKGIEIKMDEFQVKIEKNEVFIRSKG